MWSYLRYLLLALAAVHALSFVGMVTGKFAGLDGLLMADRTPIAGDFINLYSAAQLTLQGRVGEVMDPERLVAFEKTLIPQPIGVRLWAYPPHSLLLAWPFGIFGFFASLALFSAFGLAILLLGARRIGLPWVETGILVLSPGALHALYYGQTGNIAVGLLLLALSARHDGDRVSALSGALLTIKPQLGFLLPLLWAIESRWRLILLTGIITLLLVGVALLLWGLGPWEDYRDKALVLLHMLERNGEGPFLNMIPSVFISGRVLGVNPDLALLVHGAVAVVVAAVLVWRLLVVKDGELRVAMLLTATPLISPYLHSYDLAVLAVAGLIVARRTLGEMNAAGLLVAMAVLVNWALPNILLVINAAHVPAAPIAILALFLIAAFRPAREPLSPPAVLTTIPATTGGAGG